LSALQPTGCGLAPARNREFQTTGTGDYQAISERIRELSGGRKRERQIDVAGLQGVAGIPFLRAAKSLSPGEDPGAAHGIGRTAAPGESSKIILL
jgi:hypothetical protein